MDKVIVTVLLIIGGVVSAFAIVNGIYPALERSNNALASATNQVNDQIKSQIEIININNNASIVQIWVKNVGESVINRIENSDVFLASGTSIQRITYGTVGPTPYWSYEIKDSSGIWGTTVTNEITIHLSSPLPAGSYQVKIVIPNGIYDEAAFGE